MGRNFLDVEKNLKPTLACDPKSMLEKVKFERIFSLPTVVFHPFLIDSAEFSSVPDLTAGTGIQNTTSSPEFVRTDVPTSGGPAVQIALTSQCPIRKPGQPLQVPCWSEHVTYPEKGRFSLDEGFSGTTAQRLPVRTAVSTGNTGLYGARVGAVQGILDRSAIETYTKVPQPYVDVGLVPMVATSTGPTHPLDCRGLVYLDWAHGSSFGAPNGAGHLQTYWRSDWRFPTDTEYWANWKKDVVVLKSRIATPFSFCPLPTEVFATPLEFSFFGAGLRGPVALPAGQILTGGAVDPSGNFRVSSDRPASGNFGAVQP